MTDRNSLLVEIDLLARCCAIADPYRVEKHRLRARALVAQLVPPTRLLECPDCGVAHNSPRRLAEHAYYVHAAPIPDHWQNA